MVKKKKKLNIFEKILNSLYYDHRESGRKKNTERLPVDKEADRIKSKSGWTY